MADPAFFEALADDEALLKGSSIEWSMIKRYSREEMLSEFDWGMGCEGDGYHMYIAPDRCGDLLGKEGSFEVNCGYVTEDDINLWLCEVNFYEPDGIERRWERASAISADDAIFHAVDASGLRFSDRLELYPEELRKLGAQQCELAADRFDQGRAPKL